MKLMVLLPLLVLIPVAMAQDDVSKDPLSVMRIERAKGDIREMDELGIGTAFVKDELIDAENALQSRDYQLVLEKTESISSRKERALEILDSISALELRIGEVSKIGDTSDALEKLKEAKAHFESENYPEAEDAVFEGERSLRQLEGEYSIIKARYSAARDNAISYVKWHWKTLFFAVFLVIALIVISYLRISKMKNMKMLEDMRIERKVLGDLVRKVQKEYFNESRISRRIYDIKTGKYRERMLVLDEKIPIYEAKFD
jgi:hypothetical protein